MTEVPCAGAIVVSARRLLLIRRGTEPGKGLWSVPGGRCLPGESTREASVRESAEETGLSVVPRRLAGSVRRDGPGATVYLIDDYLCDLVGGTLQPGDDAEQAAWFGLGQLDGLALVPQLLECLDEWGVLAELA